MHLLLVGIGGLFGGISRFHMGRILSERSDTSFPVGTFVVNITGAFLLGLLSGLPVKPNLYLLFGEGFLGAFTTFSTFLYEGLNLFSEHEAKSALFYIPGSLLLGVFGYVAGYMLGCAL